jgi:hypothetical protein
MQEGSEAAKDRYGVNSCNLLSADLHVYQKILAAGPFDGLKQLEGEPCTVFYTPAILVRPFVQCWRKCMRQHVRTIGHVDVHHVITEILVELCLLSGIFNHFFDQIYGDLLAGGHETHAHGCQAAIKGTSDSGITPSYLFSSCRTV